eukprot:7916548-Heterocapsa_arctica.AAC.1
MNQLKTSGRIRWRQAVANRMPIDCHIPGRLPIGCKVVAIFRGMLLPWKQGNPLFLAELIAGQTPQKVTQL